MAGALTAAIAAAFSGGAAVVADDYFEYTTLLLPGSGTNGAQNNTFLDGSTNNFTITRNGNTTQGTFSPFSQTGWGNYFDGTGDYLTVADNAAMELGSSNFCIEFWINTTTSVQYDCVIGRESSTTGTGMWSFQLNSASAGSGDIAFWCWDYNSFSSPMLITTGVNLRDGAWHHVALVRNGSAWAIYVDGVSRATQTSSITIGNISLQYWIGNNQSASTTRDLQGYLSNFRYVVGNPVYTGAFTPPTSPLSATQSSGTNINAITGTQTALLTCQANRFIDSSAQTTPNTPTPVGGVSVVAFSPFNPTSSWSAATYGGSGYFDGSGDYLSVADNTAWDFGSGDFTVECLYYPTTSNAQQFMVAQWDGVGGGTGLSWGLFTSNDANRYLRFITSTNGSGVSFDLVSTTSLVLNAWNHVAIVRNGNTFQLYLNGTAATGGSTTSAITLYNATNSLTIGATSNGTQLATGYLSNVRIVKGTAVYTGAFTPPTAPLTAITNTSLLLNFTNAGVYDATSKNDLETVGDAQISNTTAKWGSTSIKFDGTGDSLLSPSSNLFTLGDSGANFTIDFWIYVDGTQTSSTVAVAGTWVNNSSAYTNRWLIGLYSSGSSIVWHNSSAGASAISSSITSSAWNYVAIVRSGSTITMYINGSSVGTQTTNQAYTTDSPLRLGGGITGVGDFKGYLQDFRITKGYARTITTPTAAFPTL